MHGVWLSPSYGGASTEIYRWSIVISGKARDASGAYAMARYHAKYTAIMHWHAVYA